MFGHYNNWHAKRPHQPFLQPSLATVDARIFPLVQALNATGQAKTIASCAGHMHLHFFNPYVSFEGEVSFVESLDLQIQNSMYGRGKRLNFYWEIYASFHPNTRQLCFTLSAPARQFEKEPLLKKTIFWRTLYSLEKQDIAEITNFIHV